MGVGIANRSCCSKLSLFLLPAAAAAAAVAAAVAALEWFDLEASPPPAAMGEIMDGVGKNRSEEACAIMDFSGVGPV